MSIYHSSNTRAGKNPCRIGLICKYINFGLIQRPWCFYEYWLDQKFPVCYIQWKMKMY